MWTRFAIVGEFLNWSVDAGSILALPLHHSDLELDSIGLSTKDHVAILVGSNSSSYSGVVGSEVR